MVDDRTDHPDRRPAVSPTAVRTEGLSVAYRTRTRLGWRRRNAKDWALRGVDLTVEPGRVLGVIGVVDATRMIASAVQDPRLMDGTQAPTPQGVRSLLAIRRPGATR